MVQIRIENGMRRCNIFPLYWNFSLSDLKKNIPLLVSYFITVIEKYNLSVPNIISQGPIPFGGVQTLMSIRLACIMLLNTFRSLHINLSAGELDIGWIILSLLNKIKEGDNYPLLVGGWYCFGIVCPSIHPITYHFSAATDWT